MIRPQVRALTQTPGPGAPWVRQSTAGYRLGIPPGSGAVGCCEPGRCPAIDVGRGCHAALGLVRRLVLGSAAGWGQAAASRGPLLAHRAG